VKENEIKKEGVQIKEVMTLNGNEFDLNLLKSIRSAPKKDVKKLQLMLTIFKALGMVAPSSTKVIYDPFVIDIIRKERDVIRLR
jgi:hypothetical protein